MKTFYADKATKENGWGFDFYQADRLYDPITHVKLMNDGKLNGWILQGFNVLNSLPNKKNCCRYEQIEILSDYGSTSN